MLRSNHPWWRQAMRERGELIEPEPPRFRLRHAAVAGVALIGVAIVTACTLQLL